MIPEETPHIFVDFNALTEDESVRLTAPFIARQVTELGIKPGDTVIITDGGLDFTATVEDRPDWGLVAVVVGTASRQLD